MTSENTSLRLTIESLAPDGLGLAHVEGFPLKFAGTLPGEEVMVSIDRTKRPWRGEVLDILTPSPLCRTLTCPHIEEAPRCGGCPWGMVTPEGQATLKRQLTLDALSAEGISAPSEVIHHSATQQAGYRSKALFTLIKNGDTWLWGLYANGSHEVVVTPVCQAIPNWMNSVAGVIATVLGKTDLTPYDEKTHQGDVRSLLLREGVNREGKVERLVSLILRSVTEKTLSLLKNPLLEALLPWDVKVVSLYEHTTRGNAVLGEKEYFLTEAHTISTTIDGAEFAVGSSTFLQIHREQMLALYQEALNWAEIEPGDTFLDLYCGVGTMTILGARQATKSIGVDVVEASIAAARENAKRNQIANAEFFAGTVETVLPSLIVKGVRADKMIVDPAFKGMEASVPAMIKALSPRRLVYVSCNPKSFARDAKRLLELGFKLERSATFDLFPDTAHVESVGLFTRG